MKNRHTSRMTDDGRPAPYVCRTINKSTHNTHTYIDWKCFCDRYDQINGRNIFVQQIPVFDK